MKVEIWSDVACPWCLVGTKRFEAAVAETGAEVDVVYRSFELDPTVPRDGDAPPLVEYLTKKFGDRGRVAAAHHRLDQAGAELGIEFNWGVMRRANTFDCHRLLAWALETAGAEAQRTLKKEFLKAYFTEGKVMTDPSVLTACVAEAGLDADAGAEVLSSGRYADDVRSAREEAHRNGIAAVPTFIIDDEHMLQGALDTDVWIKVLRRLWTDSRT